MTAPKLPPEELNKKCPCCGQDMPETDFMLYPKSAAIIYQGYVLQPGLVQYHIIEKLWKEFPNRVPSELLLTYCYHGSNKYEYSRNLLSTHIAALRRKLKKMDGIRITNLHSSGYALQLG